MNELLIGKIGELMFEHYCFQNGFAYIKLEEIYNRLTGQCILTFCYNYMRIDVKIPDSLESELRDFAKPTNKNVHHPTFVYDYLTVNLRYSFDQNNGIYSVKPSLSQNDFCWIEVKTGNSPLSANQIEFARKAKLKVKLFRIRFNEFINSPKISHGMLLDEVGPSNICKEEEMEYTSSPTIELSPIDVNKISELKIKESREKSGLSQVSLAVILKTSLKDYIEIEEGLRYPTYEQAEILAKFLNLNILHFFELRDKMDFFGNPINNEKES
jgi:DNA-binding XRE family transcriptional regulator